MPYQIGVLRMHGRHMTFQKLEVGQNVAAVAGQGLLGVDHVPESGSGFASSSQGRGRRRRHLVQLLMILHRQGESKWKRGSTVMTGQMGGQSQGRDGQQTRGRSFKESINANYTFVVCLFVCLKTSKQSQQTG